MRLILACFCFIVFHLHANLTRTLLPHPFDPGQKIEVLTEAPQGRQTFPLIVFLHGVSMLKGAADFSPKVFEYWLEQGIGVAAISLPGFGSSDGPRDFCGSFTLAALNKALDFISEELYPTRLGIVGFGIGGMASSLLANQRSDLCCVVSANGGYDLSRLLKKEDPFRAILEKHKYIIEFSEQEVQMRSPLEVASTISSPLFLIHRKLNSLVPQEEVTRFSDAVNQAGGDCTLCLLEGGDIDTKISHQEVIDEAGEWIEQHLTSKK